ncbi:MAG: hypothetical protein ACE37E_01095 [Hyphomicrobiales bacterium]
MDRLYQWRGLSIAMKLGLINEALAAGKDTYDLAKGIGVPEAEIWNTLAKSDAWGVANG